MKQLKLRTKMNKQKKITNILSTLKNKNYYTDITLPHYVKRFVSKNDIPEIDDNSADIGIAFLDFNKIKNNHNYFYEIWEDICYGGTIILENFNENSNDLFHKNFKKYFNENFSDQSITSKQLLVDGQRENFWIINCYNKKLAPTFSDKISDKIAIISVLKSGGDYDYKYVNALYNGIINNTTTIDFNFYCFTDAPENINENIKIIPLKNNYPTWWSKMEIFAPNIIDEKNVYYFDLDTIIVDNIDNILEKRHSFSLLRDFFSISEAASGVMAWKQDMAVHRIYDIFSSNSKKYISTYHGDQDFLKKIIKNFSFLQDFHPKEIVSIKKDCELKNNILEYPQSSKIICFHGKPRVHQYPDKKFLNNFWNHQNFHHG